jgi:PAS domain S-box-containing protein
MDQRCRAGSRLSAIWSLTATRAVGGMATVRSVNGAGTISASQGVEAPLAEAPLALSARPPNPGAPAKTGIPSAKTTALNPDETRSDFEELLRTTDEPTAIANLTGTLLGFNAAATQLFGYQPDELTGHNLVTLFASDISGFLSEARGNEAGNWYLLGQSLHFVIDGVRRTGVRFPIFLTLTPLSGSMATLVLASMREASTPQSLDGMAGTTARRAVTQEMTAFQKELLVQVARGHGATGIAEALHGRTGRKVLIRDGEGLTIATAGFGLGDLESLNQPNHERLSPLHAACQRDGPSWTAAAAPDQTVLGWISLHDPVGDLPEEGFVAIEQATSILTSELLRMTSVAGATEWTALEFVEALLEGTDIERLSSHARLLAYEIDRPHRAVAIQTSGDRNDGLDAAEQAARSVGVKTPLVTSREDRVILLVADDLDWEGLVAALGTALGSPSKIGLGKRYKLGELNRSLDEAVFALELGGAMSLEKSVTSFGDLGVWRILADSGEPLKLRELVDDWIGELIEHDRVHGSELVKTLSIYLDKSCATEAAAAELFVHRNTLRYRLAKVSQITGRDLADPDVRFQLQLACRAWVVLQALDAV